MRKNILLNLANIVCKFSRLLLVLAFLSLTILFIHIQIDKGFYEGSNVELNKYEFFYSIIKHEVTSLGNNNERAFTIDKVTMVSLYINYLRYTLILGIIFMIFKEFQKIIESAQNIETFQKENVVSFRRIGNYIFGYFLLTSIYFMGFETGSLTGFNVSFTPLLLVLLAYIMAELFKEGHLLKQENDLTI